MPDLPSPKARYAIALTLLDVAAGPATLWGMPGYGFAPYQYPHHPALPDDWAVWCYDRGWLRLEYACGIPHWVPTGEAVGIARAWIAELAPLVQWWGAVDGGEAWVS